MVEAFEYRAADCGPPGLAGSLLLRVEVLWYDGMNFAWVLRLERRPEVIEVRLGYLSNPVSSGHASNLIHIVIPASGSSYLAEV